VRAGVDDHGRVFPETFLWGAATAPHQIEGGNVTSDTWVLEHVPGTFYVEPSGDACDSYHRYEEDLDLLAASGLTTYRFGVEWARIEPVQGFVSRAELDHYGRMVAACKARGITPVITLNHFTCPAWMAAAGAWKNPDSPAWFASYARTVAEHLGDGVGWWCTLNEPNLGMMFRHGRTVAMGASQSSGVDRAAVYAELARRLGAEPGAVSSGMLISSRVGVANVTDAHRQAREAIKAVNPSAMVGWTLALVDVQPGPGGDEHTANLRRLGFETFLETSRDDDFVGVQTYTREVHGPDGQLPVPDDVATFQTGWEVYPEALGHTVRWAAQIAGVPILVTENGMATADDDARIAYTRGALEGLAGCIADGIDVRGYLHWSLLDNFEWTAGFAITFGLIAVDRTTFARTAKPSLDWLGALAQRNGSDIEPKPEPTVP
jgi:beta-glucosidase